MNLWLTYKMEGVSWLGEGLWASQEGLSSMVLLSFHSKSMWLGHLVSCLQMSEKEVTRTDAWVFSMLNWEEKLMCLFPLTAHCWRLCTCDGNLNKWCAFQCLQYLLQTYSCGLDLHCVFCSPWTSVLWGNRAHIIWIGSYVACPECSSHIFMYVDQDQGAYLVIYRQFP